MVWKPESSTIVSLMGAGGSDLAKTLSLVALFAALVGLEGAKEADRPEASLLI